MLYRPEIDGLRALAVTIVILFHAQFQWMKGGYVGVDVFFVISGYLITSNLLKTGIPSFGEFYSRRIRRLFPALLATSALTLLAAFFVMGPVDLAKTARSTVLAITSTSNIGFWFEAGYWDTDSKIKPLLHTWSLSVEEQFYLVWPLLIFLSMKLGRLGVMLIMTAVLTVGFAISAWFVNINSAAVFYLTPFRVYQFAIGAILATLFYWRGDRAILTNSILREFALLLGLALILIPSYFYDGTPQYLGALAAVPCIGAMLIIIGGRTKVFGVLFDNPVSVYIGRISYSLYLVHWPLMALYSYTILRGYNTAEQLSIISVTFLLGILLYYGVEQRFRKPSVSSLGRATSAVKFNSVTAGLASACVAGAAFLWVSPIELRPAEVGEFDIGKTLERVNLERYQDLPPNCYMNRTACYEVRQDRKNIIILGDSHGIDGYNIMRQLYSEAHIILAATNGCDMLPGLDGSLYKNEELRRRCQGEADALFSNMEFLNSADLIVFSFKSNASTNPAIYSAINLIRETYTGDILVLGQGPIFIQELVQIIRKEGLTLEQPNIPELYLSGYTASVNDEFIARAEAENYIFVDKTDFFCPNTICRASLSVTGNVPISYDRHHLTYEAAVAFGRHLRSSALGDVLSIGRYDPLPEVVDRGDFDASVFSSLEPASWTVFDAELFQTEAGLRVVFSEGGGIFAFNPLRPVVAGETYVAKATIYSDVDVVMNLRVVRFGNSVFEQTLERINLLPGEHTYTVSHTFAKDHNAARINLDVAGLAPISIEIRDVVLLKED